ncbi:MAG: tetratricopeptide repeat protein [Marinifilaceae bacterium]
MFQGNNNISNNFHTSFKATLLNSIFLLLLLVNISSVTFGRDHFSSDSNNPAVLTKQLTNSPDSIRLQTMLKLAEYYLPIRPDSLEYWSNQALSLAFQLKHKISIARSYFNLARYHNINSNYSEALRYYYKSLETYEDIKSTPGLIACFNNIGNLHYRQKQFEKALDYYLKSLELNKEIDQKNLGATYNNIGSIYLEKNDLEKAKEYYLKAKTEYTNQDNQNGLATILLNIGIIEDQQNEFKTAISNFKQALTKFIATKNKPGIITAHSSLGQTFIKLNRWISAGNHLNKAMNLAVISDDLEWQLKINRFKAELYSKKKDFEKALFFYQKFYQLHDSIFTLQKSEQIAQLVTKYETEQKNRKIEQLEEKEKHNRLKWNFLISSILIILLFTGILIYKQNKKIKKDKEIIIKNKQIHEAQKALLAAKLEYKGNELQNFALHIIQKNNFLQNIKENLKKVKQFANEENRELLKKTNIQIQQNLQLGQDIEIFQQKINRMNEDFFLKLTEKFPSLTEKEKKLCALLKLNLSSKEIASLNNISERAVVMARYRLRKKIQLPKEKNLPDFLNKV